MIYSVLLLNCSTVRVFNKKTNLRSDIKSDFRSDIRSVHESTHTSSAAIFSLAAFCLIGLPIATRSIDRGRVKLKRNFS